jgi:hypothetical protein
MRSNEDNDKEEMKCLVKVTVRMIDECWAGTEREQLSLFN